MIASNTEDKVLWGDGDGLGRRKREGMREREGRRGELRRVWVNATVTELQNT